MPPPSASSADQTTQAQAAALSPTEASELSQLLDSPEARDAFTPEQRADLKAFITGKDGPMRSASELTSDLSKLKDANEVPERFTSDLALVHPHLLDAALTRDEKATRLFQFVLPYVKATQELAQTPQQLKQASGQLVKEAEKAGVGDLIRETDGKNGLEVLQDALKQPLEADKLQTVRFDAPVWPKEPPGTMEQRASAAEHERSLAVQSQRSQLEGFRPPPSILQQPIGVRSPADRPEASTSLEAGHRDGRGGKLSGRMLWNVLHLFRDDGRQERESAAQREAMSSLVVVGALVLGFLAIIIGILVAL